MMEAGLLLLNTLVWTLLALAMPKHARQLLGKATTRKQQITLRTTAITAMALGILTSTHHWGTAQGLILYTLSLAPPGLFIVLALGYLKK